MSKKKNRHVATPAQKQPAKTAAAPNSFLSSPAFVLVLMLAVSFLIYGRTLGFGFALDDTAAIAKNRFTLQGVSGIPGILSHDLFYGLFGEQVGCLQGGRYRPLSLVSFALETQLFGVKGGVYHFTNVLLYALTGFLLFAVSRRVLRSRLRGSAAFTVPLIASLLFIAHPLHTEVVANIKSRDEILALLGALAAFWFSLRYFEENRVADLTLSGFFMFLGLMSKEDAGVFCLLIPATLWLFRSFDKRKLANLAITLFAAAGVYLVIRWAVLHSTKIDPARLVNNPFMHDLINNPFLDATFLQKYATIFYTLLLYLKLLVFPHPLTFDYYPYHIQLLSWTDWRVLAGFALNFVLLVAAVLGLTKKRPWALGLWYYLVPLAMVSNLFVMIGVFMAERFMYFPSLAFCLFAGYAFGQWLPALIAKKAGKGKTFSWAVFAVCAVTFAAMSFDRSAAWKDDFTLATTDVQVSSGSVKSNLMAGDGYRGCADTMTNPVMKREYLALAEKHLRKALEVYPHYESTCLLLGRVLQSEGDYQGAANAFRSVFSFYPQSSQAQANLGALFAQQLWNPDSAIVHLRAAIQLSDAIPDAHYNIGTVFLMNGTNPDSAIAHLTRAAQLDSLNANIWNNLGAAWQYKGDLNMAMNIYQHAYRLDPRQANTIQNIQKLEASMAKR